MSLLSTKQVPLEFQVEQKKFKKYHKIKYKNIKPYISRQSGGFSLSSQSHLYIYLKKMLAILKTIKPAMKSIKNYRYNGKKRKCLLEFEPNMDSILTKKPKDIRMGRGKGVPSDKVNTYKMGVPLFTLYNLSSEQAAYILASCSKKFSSKSKVITNSK